ncbi:MAG: hypothetical protein ACI4WV_03120 [Eubacteriales bacterium]
MKQNYTVPVRLSEELARKLIYIAQAEGRTPNNQFTFMLRNNIQYFEKTKGRISPAALAAIDLSPYRDTAGEEIREDRRPEESSGGKED